MLKPRGILPIMTIPGPPPSPPPLGGPKAPPPSRCMRSRNSWMCCCSSSSFPMPKSWVRPCAPLTLTDSVGPSAPAPFRGKFPTSPLFCPPPFPIAPPSPLVPPNEESEFSMARLWKPRPAAASAAKALLDCSCWRDASINSASTLAAGFSGFSTTSCVKAANPMNSIRTTYLPRAKPERVNLPSEFVAPTYFFPVRVFAAVTVTPGSGVLPLRAEPEISKVTGAGAGGVAGAWGAEAGAGVSCCCTGTGGGGASCARDAFEPIAKMIAPKQKMNMLRPMSFRINFKSKTPRQILVLRRIRLLVALRFGHSRPHSHFLHPLPLPRADDHHHLWHERVVLHGTVHEHMIPHLDIRHRHAFAAFAERGLFVQLECLRDVVWPEHRNFRRVHRLHFAENEILSEFAAAHHHSAAGAAHTGAALRASVACDDYFGQVLVSGAFRANEDHVSHFEIREFRALPVFAIFGFVCQFHRDAGAIHPRELQRAILNGCDFAHHTMSVPLFGAL